ncbi:MAG TPA: hypothetical protein VHR41_17585 [Gemmatimonadales bacterium]|jgi:hypothetical protein|nr:hypothetical protein [Gemmatimonadales bacterium]
MFSACTVATIMTGGLAVAACGTDSVPTAPETGSSPFFRTEKSPSGPGAQVSRSNGQFFATFKAPGAPYFVAIGATASAAADFCTGGDPEFGASKDLFVEAPNGNVNFVFKSDGKVPLLLFPAGTESICDGSPVAEGTGLYTDISSNLFGGHGRGTSGFRIRGQVRDQAGDKHHVLVVVQSQLGPTGFNDLVVKIKVN